MATKKSATKKVTKKAVSKKATTKTTKKIVSKSVNKNNNKSGFVKVGASAPAFNLLDQNGKPVKLDQFSNKIVVLYFYPRAMTPGCTVQACGIRDKEKEFDKLGAVILGVSPDKPESLQKFIDKEKLNFTLLSDPEKETAKSYGAFGLKKFMGREFMGILRSTFIIDRSGKIVHVMPKVDTKTHHQDVIDFIKNNL